jgi:hypothetical protein
MIGLAQLLSLGAALLTAGAPASGSSSGATIASCGRVHDTHYSFSVTAHGAHAPPCRKARRVARRAVGHEIDGPHGVPGWSCSADYYYDGPWSFLCIRRRTYGQVSIDHFKRLSPRGAASATGAPPRGRGPPATGTSGVR